MPLSQFSHARVTFNARFQTLYDQAGLCFILPGAAGSGESKWIKTGVEFMDGKTNLSTVASDRWADWSLTPLPATYRSAGGPGAITIEMERYVIDGEPIDTLAIYVVHEPEDDSQPNERQLMREVTWVFEPGQLENQCWVGVMAAKPTKDDDDPERALEVTFSKFEISTIHDTRLPEEGRKGI
ncbi:MAG: hypothetical protein MMC33_001636 [Icmadophila ericetorum]|nr:hypothetical protein [Icmadophila ericetorum]